MIGGAAKALLQGPFKNCACSKLRISDPLPPLHSKMYEYIFLRFCQNLPPTVERSLFVNGPSGHTLSIRRRTIDILLVNMSLVLIHQLLRQHSTYDNQSHCDSNEVHQNLPSTLPPSPAPAY